MDRITSAVTYAGGFDTSLPITAHMRGLKTFVGENWFSLFTIGMLLAGAIYQFGFKEAELKMMQAYSEQTRETQTKKIAEFDVLRQDVERLKWEMASYGRAIDEVKVDVRATARDVQQLDKKVEVIIEMLLKPRTGN